MARTHWQLDTIAALQRHLLPKQVPQPAGWDIAVHYAVSPWPGGNYYDFLPLRDGRLVLLIGGASDAGGPSSVLVALVRASMHSCPLNCGVERLPFCPMHGEVVQPPHLILANLNRVLADNSLDEQYMTAFCGILNPVEGVLHFANAGHLPPFLWRASSKTIEEINYPSGTPLGLDPHASYHHKRLAILPGDVLLFYTKGLTAARDRHGVLFGRERLKAAFQELASFGTEALKDGLLQEWQTFLDGQEVQDDVTLLALERRIED